MKKHVWATKDQQIFDDMCTFTIWVCGTSWCISIKQMCTCVYEHVWANNKQIKSNWIIVNNWLLLQMRLTVNSKCTNNNTKRIRMQTNTKWRHICIYVCISTRVQWKLKFELIGGMFPLSNRMPSSLQLWSMYAHTHK